MDEQQDAAPAEEASEEPDTKKSKSMAEGRRPRGWLEADVKRVCDQYVTGEVKIEGGLPLTPHRCGRLVKELDGLEEAPSTGAVAAVFDRWEEIGFAQFSENPRAFSGYTDAGQERGLGALKAEHTERRKQAREAAKKSADSK